jgi:hypothetical protein
MSKAVAVIPAHLIAAGIVIAPLANADGTQASAEQAVRSVYEQVQRGCTPQTPPQFQRIVWNSVTGQGGTGRIIDATPGLGGPFQVWWDNTNQAPMAGYRKVPAQPQGYWDVNLEFC